MTPCRCGYDGTGEHPCHGRGYTCREPAMQRFYGAHLAALSGQQMKVGAHETWACDECWRAYRAEAEAMVRRSVL